MVYYYLRMKNNTEARKGTKTMNNTRFRCGHAIRALRTLDKSKARDEAIEWLAFLIEMNGARAICSGEEIIRNLPADEAICIEIILRG